ncbi:hypothetical protein BDR26DRAFT_973457 [Obelidium mucronatum]|nr:hypothetical protein BDR26DRAFT_973457 [Obelidium mucronatum]
MLDPKQLRCIPIGNGPMQPKIQDPSLQKFIDMLPILNIGTIYNQWDAFCARVSASKVEAKSVRQFALAEHGDTVAVTSVTGIAVSHIGGVTVASFVGCGLLKDDLTANVLVTKIKRNNQALSRWKSIKVWIIDKICWFQYAVNTTFAHFTMQSSCSNIFAEALRHLVIHKGQKRCDNNGCVWLSNCRYLEWQQLSGACWKKKQARLSCQELSNDWFLIVSKGVKAEHVAKDLMWGCGTQRQPQMKRSYDAMRPAFPTTRTGSDRTPRWEAAYTNDYYASCLTDPDEPVPSDAIGCFGSSESNGDPMVGVVTAIRAIPRSKPTRRHTTAMTTRSPRQNTAATTSAPQGRVIDGFFEPVVGGVAPTGLYVGQVPVHPGWLERQGYKHQDLFQYRGWMFQGGHARVETFSIRDVTTKLKAFLSSTGANDQAKQQKFTLCTSGPELCVPMTTLGSATAVLPLLRLVPTNLSHFRRALFSHQPEVSLTKHKKTARPKGSTNVYVAPDAAALIPTVPVSDDDGTSDGEPTKRKSSGSGRTKRPVLKKDKAAATAKAAKDAVLARKYKVEDYFPHTRAGWIKAGMLPHSDFKVDKISQFAKVLMKGQAGDMGRLIDETWADKTETVGGIETLVTYGDIRSYMYIFIIFFRGHPAFDKLVTIIVKSYNPQDHLKVAHFKTVIEWICDVCTPKNNDPMKADCQHNSVFMYMRRYFELVDLYLTNAELKDPGIKEKYKDYKWNFLPLYGYFFLLQLRTAPKLNPRVPDQYGFELGDDEVAEEEEAEAEADEANASMTAEERVGVAIVDAMAAVAGVGVKIGVMEQGHVIFGKMGVLSKLAADASVKHGCEENCSLHMQLLKAEQKAAVMRKMQ